MSLFLFRSNSNIDTCLDRGRWPRLAFDIAHLAPEVEHYNPGAEIGDVSVGWNEDISVYHLNDILRMVIFYNNNFNIIAGGNVSTMRDKFFNWLLESVQ